ncbi:MAG: hypothetical protein H6553_13085 [Chitinophagales bacterium]|nr:hypothetical protein [Chitinophagales bacterium]
MNKISLILLLVFCLTACDSKNKSEINNSKSVFELGENGIDTVLILLNSKEVLVLRTDFSSDSEWEYICDMISESGKDLGFKPYVEFLNRREFKGLKQKDILNMLCYYKHPLIFIVDNITIENKEYPILCVDLYDELGASFRVIPSEIWSVENNLSIANMDFLDFMNATDKDEIFRGYK